ncbi:MAG: hypothetical protein WBQ09_05230 [Terriglobales bacterium]|jgi:hypothetical protein
MRKNEAGWLGLFLLVAGLSRAQVVSPAEIKDPTLRNLQVEYADDLRSAGQDILATQFDYPFYLSRKLDLDQAQQLHADQNSIRFDSYNGKTVIAVTGNYYVAYSADKVGAEERARSTLLNAVMPILKATVPRFQSNQHVQGYAVEISHHIMGKVMGVSMERPENLMVFVPQSAALRLLASKDEDTRQAALMQGQIFLNAEPVTVWLSGTGPQLASHALPVDRPADGESGPAQAGAEIATRGSDAGSDATATSANISKPSEPPPPPVRDTSPEVLSSLQASKQSVVDQIVKALDPQAHFVSYAPPKFVAFRQGIYLELSLSSTLPASAAGSRYKLAALAFDDHVASLIRPLLAYFKDEQEFDGVSFSTTVHLLGKAANTSEAVEFYFPLASLRSYEKYDCTGQHLLDGGTVLINGERVALDLQMAEGGSNH